MSLPKLHKAKALAEMFGVSLDFIATATELGDLRPAKIEGHLYYAEDEARRWAPFPNRGRHTRIYFIQEGLDGPVKIGNATSPERRLQDHQCGNPRTLRLLGSFAGRAYQEGKIHERFADVRLRGEWFQPTPELLAYIAEVCP